MSDFQDLFRESIEASLELKRSILEGLLDPIQRAASLLRVAYEAENKALFFGNGGSAADAQHLAAEMEGRFRLDRRPLPALALHANVSTVTAIANDYGYEEVFARLLTAHARAGDVAIALTTSGASKNVVAAAKLTKPLGIRLIVLTGNSSSALEPFADVVIAVPSQHAARIQEAHILIGHILCDYVERSLFSDERRA